MSKKPQEQEQRPSRSPFWTSVQILLVIALIAIIPIVLQEVEIDPETARHIGRGIAAAGVILVIYALIKQMTKIVLILAVAAIVFAVLVSEGIIDLPQLMSK